MAASALVLVQGGVFRVEALRYARRAALLNAALYCALVLCSGRAASADVRTVEVHNKLCLIYNKRLGGGVPSSIEEVWVLVESDAYGRVHY
ncbi:hypothetical protein LTR95_016846 [Oleoguttula sp. CCFEE 5521]